MSGGYDSAQALRGLTLGAGTLSAVFLLLAFVPKLVSVLDGTSPAPAPGHEWEGQVMGAMVLTFMMGYAIGWWRPLWGGLLICLAAVIVSAPFIIIQGHFNSLVFGMPLFVVGVLYVALSLLESREKASTR